jgi:type IV pilus assembly protein PilO
MAPPAKAAAKAPQALAAQLTPPTIAGVVVMMVGALLVLYYLLLYSPLAEDLVREQGRSRTVAASLRRIRTDERDYNDAVAELERSRSHARDLQRILPDNADIPGFMRSINSLAESSGLAITLIEPAEEHSEQYFIRVPVRIQVEGTYLSLARFFRAVSQLPRVINMENIALGDAHEHDGEVRLRARALATTFRSLNDSEQAAAHQGAPAPAPPAGGRR